jgi:Histidine kinase-like ATPase domain
MTANPLRLVSSAASGVGWQWLTPAVEMAALASGNWPLAPEPGPMGWTCSSRIATRTPGSDAGSVCAARGFTVATLRRWGAAQRCEDIAVVVSELLTNALRHAPPPAEDTPPRWPVRLGLLQCGPCVLCAVADPCQRVPVPAEPGELAENGRGLEVIGALSDTWGYTTVSELGKVVWATFCATPDPPGGATDAWPNWLTDSQDRSACQ